jgi:hypothetical protein
VFAYCSNCINLVTAHVLLMCHSNHKPAHTVSYSNNYPAKQWDSQSAKMFAISSSLRCMYVHR